MPDTTKRRRRAPSDMEALTERVRRQKGHAHNNMQNILRKLGENEALTFGERIALMRNTQGMLQEDLAKKAGINVTILSEYETGKRPVDGLKLGNVRKVADALGASLDELLGRTPA